MSESVSAEILKFCDTICPFRNAEIAPGVVCARAGMERMRFAVIAIGIHNSEIVGDDDEIHDVVHEAGVECGAILTSAIEVCAASVMHDGPPIEVKDDPPDWGFLFED